MTQPLSDAHRRTLAVLCDTAVPAIDGRPDPDGFWGRRGTEVGADVALAEVLSGLPEERLAGVVELLDGLAEGGFEQASQSSREQILRNVSMLGPEAAGGVAALTGAALFLAYAVPDPATGQNPFWSTFGYPGPVGLPADRPKPIEPLVPESDELALEADVVVVGSGAGGGVIAGTLAQRGLKVAVVEAGGYFDESDFNQLELWAYQNLYYRGGPVPTLDGNVSLQAGANLGGGTTVNWTNCLRTTPWVREQWAGEFGLEGVDGPEYDRHLDAVLERISANDRCSDYNGPSQRLRDGAAALGWSFHRVMRNADPATYSPDTAGYIGFGDQSGSKQSTTRTYLRDAADAGADILVRTTASRVLVENGRAAGVEGRYEDPVTGRAANVVVRAPEVVVACGALESPALLLRSGIGGPAVGDHLHVHPCTAVLGAYGEDQRAWWGAPHTGVVDEFADTGGGWGFLVETAQYTTGIGASAIPFTSGRAHKEALADYRFCSTSIALLRDRGHGRVTIDRDGQAVHTYSLTDEVDVANARLGIEAQAKIHEAAGAREIRTLAAGMPRWRRGDDLAAFVARAQRIPLRLGGHKLFSAHQMGSCRMGADPETSVAGPFGELHDAPGVWIGDGSAFPSASGTNPMISIMALARRTAEAIAADAPGASGSAPARTEPAPTT
jgi:choline dehydrogenase-like flavoprotein